MWLFFLLYGLVLEAQRPYRFSYREEQVIMCLKKKTFYLKQSQYFGNWFSIPAASIVVWLTATVKSPHLYIPLVDECPPPPSKKVTDIFHKTPPLSAQIFGTIWKLSVLTTSVTFGKETSYCIWQSYRSLLTYCLQSKYDIYTTRVSRRAHNIIKDNTVSSHPCCQGDATGVSNPGLQDIQTVSTHRLLGCWTIQHTKYWTPHSPASPLALSVSQKHRVTL